MEEHTIEHKMDVAYSLMTKVVHSPRLPLSQQADILIDKIMKQKRNASRYKPQNFMKAGIEIIEQAIALYKEFLTTIDYEINDEYARSVLIFAPKVKEVPDINAQTLNNAPVIITQDSPRGSRGGKRERAGRKTTMKNPVVRKVSITLPAEIWDTIDKQIENAPEIKSLGQYFRMLAEGSD